MDRMIDSAMGAHQKRNESERWYLDQRLEMAEKRLRRLYLIAGLLCLQFAALAAATHFQGRRDVERIARIAILTGEQLRVLNDHALRCGDGLLETDAMMEELAGNVDALAWTIAGYGMHCAGCKSVRLQDVKNETTTIGAALSYRSPFLRIPTATRESTSPR